MQDLLLPEMVKSPTSKPTQQDFQYQQEHPRSNASFLHI